ncbi:phenylpropionate dioxygenase-like ring-hydroxylating dioxygenase large terminal subunit [Sphingomonas jejuensis]|uniref:Phenylpropionate dioxygenase-like ring-hydroxylating dioxygenase large terminal subunit n=1 Tax=Sphingomonas jejuensis TaxID=904715 RepID=A0ABX0XJJ5_9SPHN|nr:aromatic ring-hydroxylating dioxygenase subunit alpha [Sphingomonas jejuensis]NJC32915.1 phenylpropionate dioxygenase-like ring-hydroxylating dioxygenase large terminal subunit [Sphingomonas jejuensis]
MNYDARSWKVHAGSSHAFDTAAPRIDNGSHRPDPSRYTDPAVAAAEWEQVFAKTWLLAGPSSDVRDEGDWMKFDIGVESFIIVRLANGGLAAHYNVCPHRGSRLVTDDLGSQNSFTCPFHSWEFDLEGHNIQVTDPETFRPEVLCHGTDLSSVRVEEAAGLVFISMNPDVGPLAEHLGAILPMLETYRIDDMHVIQHRRSDWAANWKGGIDAFYESYHLHAIHPQTMGIIDDRTHIDLYPNGMSRQFVPFAQPNSHFADQEGINPGIAMLMKDAGLDPDAFEGDATHSRAAIAAAKRDRAARLGLDYQRFSDAQLTDSTIFGIFPNAQIGCHPEAVFMHRFKPHADDPGQFTYETTILYKHVDVDGYNVPAWMGLSEDIDVTGETRPDVVHTGLGVPPGMGEVLDQDSDLLPIVQAGARSRGFRGPLWGEQEARLRHFHVTLDRWLAPPSAG